MIRYTVRCEAGHEFEGWYRDSKTYETLQAAGAVSCPDCGSVNVRRAPMAPALSGTKATRHDAPAPADPPHADGGGDGSDTPAAPPIPSPGPAGPPAPVSRPVSHPVSHEDAKRIHVMGKIREAMVEMRRHVEKNADYVGPKFADEARKIHHGETRERSIYGEATDAESEALRDEGIEFGRIPWVSKTDA